MDRQRDRQTDMMKVIGTFHNSVNKLNNKINKLINKYKLIYVIIIVSSSSIITITTITTATINLWKWCVNIPRIQYPVKCYQVN
jgi:hypothetical protein